MLASRLNGQSDNVRQRVAVLASRRSCKGSKLAGSSDEAGGVVPSEYTSGVRQPRLVLNECTMRVRQPVRKVIGMFDLNSSNLVVCKVGSDGIRIDGIKLTVL